MKLRINEQIKTDTCLVIGNNGEQHGILTKFEALELARKLNLDLVEVAPNHKPPVCRIMKYPHKNDKPPKSKEIGSKPKPKPPILSSDKKETIPVKVIIDK